MTRKLFSVLLCAFALLLLMGAGTAPEQTVTILAEEESAILPEDTALITDKEMDEAMGQADPAVTDVNPAEEAKEDEFVLLIDEEQGQIVELLLPPLRGGWFGAARQQAAVPWSVVKKIGSEVVVVDIGSMPEQNM